MSKRLTTEEFIKRSKLVHQETYDYSLTEYINARTKVEIICKEHGVFSQRPDYHLAGGGCKKCASDNQKNTIGNFITKSNEIHDNKYDYSLAEYINAITKVKIICEEHGVFSQKPNDHLSGYGCPICAGNIKSNVEDFITKSNEIHNNKYDYSLVNYINAHNKVEIICKEHGVFSQKPNSHLRGRGCPICKSSKGEEKIYHYLTENNIEFEREKKFKDLGNKRFDFYLSKKNIIIEYDGEQHFKANNFFGGEEGFRKRQISDLIKNQYCSDNDLQLIRIPYTEFNNIASILSAYLLQNEA